MKVDEEVWVNSCDQSGGRSIIAGYFTGLIVSMTLYTR